jgi:hypothetical protein
MSKIKIAELFYSIQGWIDGVSAEMDETTVSLLLSPVITLQ